MTCVCVFDNPKLFDACEFADPCKPLIHAAGAAQTLQAKGYKLTAAQIAQIKREDEEIITLITIIGEHLF